MSDSPFSGSKAIIERKLKKIIKNDRNISNDEERDLFDHIVRRSNAEGRVQIARLVSEKKADIKWFNSILEISNERETAQ